MKKILALVLVAWMLIGVCVGAVGEGIARDSHLSWAHDVMEALTAIGLDVSGDIDAYNIRTRDFADPVWTIVYFQSIDGLTVALTYVGEGIPSLGVTINETLEDRQDDIYMALLMGGIGISEEQAEILLNEVYNELKPNAVMPSVMTAIYKIGSTMSITLQQGIMYGEKINSLVIAFID